MHSQEVRLIGLSEAQLDDWKLEAMSLSKEHLNALEEQIARQNEGKKIVDVVVEETPAKMEKSNAWKDTQVDKTDVGEEVLKYLSKNSSNRKKK